jgi:hypothetical protein
MNRHNVRAIRNDGNLRSIAPNAIIGYRVLDAVGDAERYHQSSSGEQAPHVKSASLRLQLDNQSGKRGNWQRWNTRLRRSIGATICAPLESNGCRKSSSEVHRIAIFAIQPVLTEPFWKLSLLCTPRGYALRRGECAGRGLNGQARSSRRNSEVFSSAVPRQRFRSGPKWVESTRRS